jgi:hypothetical protein
MCGVVKLATYERKLAIPWESRCRQPDRSARFSQRVHILRRNGKLYGIRTCSIRPRAIREICLWGRRRNSLRKGFITTCGVRIDEVLTFAGDVRTVPRSLTVDRQTFRSRKTVGHVAGVAVVLKSRVEVEGCLFRKGIVTGMIDCWG